MTRKQYEKARLDILRHYGRIEQNYIRHQESGAMLIALQHEKNERLADITALFYSPDNQIAQEVRHG